MPSSELLVNYMLPGSVKKNENVFTTTTIDTELGGTREYFIVLSFFRLCTTNFTRGSRIHAAK